jgi:hypothetical protein
MHEADSGAVTATEIAAELRCWLQLSLTSNACKSARVLQATAALKHACDLLDRFYRDNGRSSRARWLHSIILRELQSDSCLQLDCSSLAALLEALVEARPSINASDAFMEVSVLLFRAFLSAGLAWALAQTNKNDHERLRPGLTAFTTTVLAELFRLSFDQRSWGRWGPSLRRSVYLFGCASDGIATETWQQLGQSAARALMRTPAQSWFALALLLRSFVRIRARRDADDEAFQSGVASWNAALSQLLGKHILPVLSRALQSESIVVQRAAVQIVRHAVDLARESERGRLEEANKWHATLLKELERTHGLHARSIICALRSLARPEAQRPHLATQQFVCTKTIEALLQWLASETEREIRVTAVRCLAFYVKLGSEWKIIDATLQRKLYQARDDAAALIWQIENASSVPTTPWLAAELVAWASLESSMLHQRASIPATATATGSERDELERMSNGGAPHPMGTLSSWDRIAQWSYQKQPVLALCAHALKISIGEKLYPESDHEGQAVATPDISKINEQDRAVVLLQLARRSLSLEGNLLARSSGRDGTLALVTCPFDACDVADVAHACMMAACVLFRECVQHAFTHTARHAIAQAWLAFSTLDLECLITSRLVHETPAFHQGVCWERWRQIRELAKVARRHLRAINIPNMVDELWLTLRADVLPAIISRLGQTAASVPRYADGMDRPCTLIWPGGSTQRKWLKGFRRCFGTLIASMPLTKASLSTWASAALLCVHPLGSAQAVSRFSAALNEQKSDLSLVDLIAEMQVIAQSLSSEQTNCIELQIDPLALLRKAIVMWASLWFHSDPSKEDTIETATEHVFENLVLPALKEIWEANWTVADLELVREVAPPDEPIAPTEPALSSSKDRALLRAATSSRTKQELQAEHDRYQRAVQLYKEQMRIYQERKTRYEQLKMQQHRLHAALAGIWAGWLEMLTALGIDATRRSLGDFVLGSMEAVHRLIDCMHWRRGQEIWLALLRFAQSRSRKADRRLDECENKVPTSSLAAILSTSRFDWIVRSDQLLAHCDSLTSGKFNFIRSQMPCLRGPLVIKNAALSIVPWLFLAESVAFDPETRPPGLSALLPLYRSVVEQIEQQPDGDLLISCAWRSFTQSVLASMLADPEVQHSTDTDEQESVEMTLATYTRFWDRFWSVRRDAPEPSIPIFLDALSDVLPDDPENSLLERFRQLAFVSSRARSKTEFDCAEQSRALFLYWRNALCRLLPFPWLEPKALLHRSLLELVPGMLSMDASTRRVCVRMAQHIPPSYRNRSLVWRLALTLASYDRHAEVADVARRLLDRPIEDVAHLAAWLDHTYASIRQAAAEAIAEAVAKAHEPASLLRQWLPVWFARFPKFTGLDPKIANGTEIRRTELNPTEPDIDFADGLSHMLLALAKRCEEVISAELLPMIFAFLCARGWVCADRSIHQRLRRAAIELIRRHGPEALPMLLSLLTTALENPPNDLEVTLQDARQESLILVLGALALYIPSSEPRVLCQAADRLVSMALATPAADVQQAAADVLNQLIPKWNSIDPTTVTQRLDAWLETALSSQRFGERRGAALLWAAALHATGGAPAWSDSVAARRLVGILNDRNAALEARLGALTLLEALAHRLRSAYEPIGVQMLPLLLQASGDNMTSVRQASADAARAFMRYLSAAKLPMVLESLLKQLDLGGSAWRARMASLDLLGSMANMELEQLTRALPEIVPRLVSALTDVHPRVQETAAEALARMAEMAIRSPRARMADGSDAADEQFALARSLSKRLVQALAQPEQYLLPVLHELRHELQHSILFDGEANGSMILLDALLLPLLRRALSHRQLSIRQGALAVLLERTRSTPRTAAHAKTSTRASRSPLILTRLEKDLVAVILRDSVPEHRYRAALALRELMRPLLSDILESLWLATAEQHPSASRTHMPLDSITEYPAGPKHASSETFPSIERNEDDGSRVSMELWNQLVAELFADHNGPTERSGAAEALASLASLHWEPSAANIASVTPATAPALEPSPKTDPALDVLMKALIWDPLNQNVAATAGGIAARESALIFAEALARHGIPLSEHSSLWRAVLDASRDVLETVRQAALGAGEALIDAARSQLIQMSRARNAMRHTRSMENQLDENCDRPADVPDRGEWWRSWFAAPCWQALEAGLIANHWRVRLACIQLGDAAMRRLELSELEASVSLARPHTPSLSDVKGNGHQSMQPPAAASLERTSSLGALASMDPGQVLYECRPAFLAHLYLLRFDPSAAIQGLASAFWKKWVPNAARTLHLLAPLVLETALSFMRQLDHPAGESTDEELVHATQGALADLCSRLGADVTAVVVTALQTLITGNDTEPGMAGATAAAASLEQIGHTLPHTVREQVSRPYLVNAARQCLERDEDALEPIRKAGGALLSQLLPVLGEQVLISEVLQPLWERFESAVLLAERDSEFDQQASVSAQMNKSRKAEHVGRGLTQVLTLRSVGERLQCRLLPPWLEAGRWDALASMLALVDEALAPAFVPLMLDRLFDSPPIHEPSAVSNEAIDTVFGSASATRAAAVLARHLPAPVLPIALERLGASDPVKRQRAISLLRFIFDNHDGTDAFLGASRLLGGVNKLLFGQMYEQLVSALADPDPFVVHQASLVWQQSIRQLSPGILVTAVVPVHEAILALGDSSPATAKDPHDSNDLSGFVLEPYTERGIAPILTLYQHGLTAPETRPEIREHAALGIAQLVQRVPPPVAQPHALRLMGLMIRLLSDRQTHWPVTVALLKALAAFWSRAGVNARALAPALQSVLLRYVRDSQRLVRQASVTGLVILLLDHPRPEPALSELFRLAQASNENPAQRLAAMECLTQLLREAAQGKRDGPAENHTTMGSAAGALDQVLAPRAWPQRLSELVFEALNASLDAERLCAAQLFAAMQRYWETDSDLCRELIQALMRHVDQEQHRRNIAWEHGRLLTIRAVLADRDISLTASLLDEMERHARNALTSEAAPLRKAAIQVLGALATRLGKESSKQAEWVHLLTERLNEDAFSEVREAALQAFGTVGSLDAILPLLLSWSYRRSGQRAPGLRTAALEALQQRLVDDSIPAIRWDELREAQNVVYRIGDAEAASIANWLEHLAMNSIATEVTPKR